MIVQARPPAPGGWECELRFTEYLNIKFFARVKLLQFTHFKMKGLFPYIIKPNGFLFSSIVIHVFMFTTVRCYDTNDLLLSEIRLATGVGGLGDRSPDPPE